MAPKPQEVATVNGVSITLNKDADIRANTLPLQQQMRTNAFVNNAFYNDDGLPACLSVASNTKINSSDDGDKALRAKGDDAAEGSEQRHLDFDDLLPHIGEFGMYQKLLFLLMIPFAFSVAFVYFTQIFITLVPEEHWCRVPELEHLSIEDRWVI